MFDCALCPASFISEAALDRHHAECPGAAAIGQRRADPGRELELLVLESARALVRQGLHLDQVGQPFRILQMLAHGKAKVQLLGKAPLDFIGHLNGRYITFETKSVAGGSLRLNHEAGIKRHQLESCYWHHDGGAIAFFLVEFRAAGEYYALAWPALLGLGDRASVPLEYCRKWCPRVERSGKVLDLVAVVRELMVRQAIVAGAMRS